MGKKFIMSYSCGKDSTLALYRMIKEGNTPAGLLVTIDKDKDCHLYTSDAADE